jgi:NAD(P)-dependent dehydrogenase (short-subunit alcohol dehydrogenase family)
VKIVVIGATGIIGAAVADALAVRHEVVRASRKSATRVDVEDPASLERLFADVQNIDAVVSCATGTPERWQRMFGPLEQLSSEHLQIMFDALRSQLHLVRLCRKHVRDGGSLTLTTGALARHPLPGTAAITMMAAGLEGLVPAAALDMPRGVRINAVSPGWVKETMEKMGMDSSPGMPAKTLADFYLAAVEGTTNGVVIDPMA